MKRPTFLDLGARRRRLWLWPLSLALLLMLAATVPAAASHSWGSYHWARTSNPFTLKLGDNVSGGWDSILGNVSADWSSSTVLDTQIVSGSGTKNCRPTTGRIEVCSGKYGFNGWLGLATIWPDAAGHITRATAKVNDSYFNASYYNKYEARRHVLCQEVGHTFGLDHQYAASCMNDRDGLFDAGYIRPNAHDFEQLNTIYTHLDSTSTVTSGTSRPGNRADAEDFEPPIPTQPGRDRQTLFEYDLGGGQKVFVWVFWAVEPGAAGLQ